MLTPLVFLAGPHPPAEALPPEKQGFTICGEPCIGKCEQAGAPVTACSQKCLAGCQGEFWNPAYTGTNTGPESANCKLSIAGCTALGFVCSLDVSVLTSGTSSLLSTLAAVLGNNTALATALIGAAKSEGNPCGYITAQCLANAPC
jgi:hypothetical protein